MGGALRGELRFKAIEDFENSNAFLSLLHRRSLGLPLFSFSVLFCRSLVDRSFFFLNMAAIDWRSLFAPSKLIFYTWFWGAHIALFIVGWYVCAGSRKAI